jgi:hypothetical protein
MAILTHTCPHCSYERLGFTFHGEYPFPSPHEKTWGMLFQCPNCHRPVAVECILQVVTAQLHSPKAFPGSISDSNVIVIRGIYPEFKAPAAPDHVPDRVAKLLLQALDAQRRQHWDMAAIMFRRVIEEAVKVLRPDLPPSTTLNKRIESLDASHTTPAMKEWAHAVRLDGNEAAHGDDMTAPEVAALSGFTELFLMYAFTLPGMLDARRAAASANGTASP